MNHSQARNTLPAPNPALVAQHPHRHDRAAAYLKELLLDGTLKPGDMVSTEGVAQALGISRAPTTDAVKRLASEGFLVVIPQVGCRVPVPRTEDVGDFYELFARSEGLVTRLAAERRSPEQAAVFAHLTASLDAEITRLGEPSGSNAAQRRINRVRHAAIHRLAGSTITADIVAGLWDRSDFYLQAAFGAFPDLRVVRAGQRAINDAIVAGDAPLAENLTARALRQIGRQAAAALEAR